MTINELAALLPNQASGLPTNQLPGLVGIPGASPDPAPTSQNTSPFGPVTSPDQVVDDQGNQVTTQDAPSLLQPQSVAAGAKLSQQGFSPAAFQQIQKSGKGLQGKIANDQAGVEAGYAPLFAQEQGAINQGAKAAASSAEAESNKALATADANRQIAQERFKFQEREQQALAQARVQSDAAMQNYRASLADFAASGVNPKQLWESGGTVGQFEMIGTAFLHDFLAAKGIQTSGMDTLKDAIKNNINAQVHNMQHKQDVAAGFKSLYDMQRAQSATDTEARQRMFGFYLEAFANQVQGKMGQYDSDLALSKGQAAIAKLREEAVKNDFAVRAHIETTKQQAAKNQIDLYGHELAAASAKVSAEAHIKAAEIAAGKGQHSPLEDIVFDREGAAYRMFLPGTPGDKKHDLRTQTGKLGETAANLEKLIQLQTEIGKVMPTGDVAVLKKLQGEASRTAELLRNVTKMGIIYDNSGKQINEQEVKLYDEIVSKNDWFTNGANVRTLGTLVKSILDKNDKVLQSVSIEIPKDSSLSKINSGNRQYDPATSTLANIQSEPGSGEHENNLSENLVKEIQKPKVDFDIEKFTDSPDRGKIEALQAKFAASHPGVIGEQRDVNSAQSDENLGKAVAGETVVDNRFAAMYELAKLALQDDPTARQQLEVMAKKNNSPAVPGFRSLTAQQGQLASEAQYFLDLLNAGAMQ